MVWLRPLHGEPGGGVGFGSVPALDEGVASAADAARAAEEETLSALLAARAAYREQEYADLLAGTASAHAPTQALSSRQCAALTPTPSSYSGGLVSGQATKRARQPNARQRTPTAAGGAPPVRPPTREWTPSLPGPLQPPPRAHPLPGRGRTPPPLPSPSDRPLSLVHLETLPATLAQPRVRPTTGALGAAVATAGLGAHGDRDLGDAELEALLSRRERDAARRVVAPQPGSDGGRGGGGGGDCGGRGGSGGVPVRTTAEGRPTPWGGDATTACACGQPAHGVGARPSRTMVDIDGLPLGPPATPELAASWPPPPPLQSAAARGGADAARGGGAEARGGAEEEAAPRAAGAMLLLQSATSHDRLRLPTVRDANRTSAAMSSFLPPPPSDSLRRAQAAELRLARADGQPPSVRLAPPPARFSSVASRLASPLEFLASITDWSAASTPSQQQHAAHAHAGYAAHGNAGSRAAAGCGYVRDGGGGGARASGGGSAVAATATPPRTGGAGGAGASLTRSASMPPRAGGGGASAGRSASTSSLHTPSASHVRTDAASAVAAAATAAASVASCGSPMHTAQLLGALTPTMASLNPAAAARRRAEAQHERSIETRQSAPQPPPPSRASVYPSATAPSPLAAPSFAPLAPAPLPPKRTAVASTSGREWVALQAGMEADFAARARAHADWTGSGVPCPYKSLARERAALGNFVASKPTPAPPRLVSETHGVPWLRDAAEVRPAPRR